MYTQEHLTLINPNLEFLVEFSTRFLFLYIFPKLVNRDKSYFNIVIVCLSMHRQVDFIYVIRIELDKVCLGSS